MYDKKPIFIPVDITEDVVKLVERKLSGISGTGNTDSKAIKVWQLKSRENTKKIHNKIEIFVDWLDNQNPLWSYYWAFISGRLIGFDKCLGIFPVGVREIWWNIFA